MPHSNSHFYNNSTPYLSYPKPPRRRVTWQRGRPQVSTRRPSTVTLSSSVQTSLASSPTFGVPPSPPPPLLMRRWISHAGKHVSPMDLEEADHLQAALPRALLFHPSLQTAGVVARCRNGALFIFLFLFFLLPSILCEDQSSLLLNGSLGFDVVGLASCAWMNILLDPIQRMLENRFRCPTYLNWWLLVWVWYVVARELMFWCEQGLDLTGKFDVDLVNLKEWRWGWLIG